MWNDLDWFHSRGLAGVIKGSDVDRFARFSLCNQLVLSRGEDVSVSVIFKFILPTTSCSASIDDSDHRGKIRNSIDGLTCITRFRLCEFLSQIFHLIPLNISRCLFFDRHLPGGVYFSYRHLHRRKIRWQLGNLKSSRWPSTMLRFRDSVRLFFPGVWPTISSNMVDLKKQNIRLAAIRFFQRHFRSSLSLSLSLSLSRLFFLSGFPTIVL